MGHPSRTYNKYIQRYVPTHTLSMILMISALHALVPLVPISDASICASVLHNRTLHTREQPRLRDKSGYGLRGHAENLISVCAKLEHRD